MILLRQWIARELLILIGWGLAMLIAAIAFPMMFPYSIFDAGGSRWFLVVFFSYPAWFILRMIRWAIKVLWEKSLL